MGRRADQTKETSSSHVHTSFIENWDGLIASIHTEIGICAAQASTVGAPMQTSAEFVPKSGFRSRAQVGDLSSWPKSTATPQTGTLVPRLWHFIRRALLNPGPYRARLSSAVFDGQKKEKPRPPLCH